MSSDAGEIWERGYSAGLAQSAAERDCYRDALRFIAQGNLNRIADLGAAGALAEVTNAALEALDHVDPSTEPSS